MDKNMRCEMRKLTRHYVRTRQHDKTFDGQCRRIAIYDIDNIQLCREHTSVILIADALEDKRITKLNKDKTEKEYRKKPKYD